MPSFYLFSLRLRRQARSIHIRSRSFGKLARLIMVVLLFIIIAWGLAFGYRLIRSKTGISPASIISQMTASVSSYGSRAFQRFQMFTISGEDAKVILQRGYPLLIGVGALTSEDNELSMNRYNLPTVFAALTGMDFSSPRAIISSEMQHLQSVKDATFTVARSFTQLNVSRGDVSQVRPAISPSDLQQEHSIPRIREALPEERVEDIFPYGEIRRHTEPRVGVYYTHTSESFISMGGVTHTEGIHGDIVEIGREFIETLENNYGIGVVYSEKIHDYPNWSLAYSNARLTAEQLVKENSSLQALFDIHRDGFDYDYISPEQARQIVATEINGEKVARILIVVTTDDFGLPHPNWRSNYAFAMQLHEAMNRMYPGLSRGIDLRKDARFNQHVHDKALLIELGGHVNNEEEVRRTARLFAHVVAEVLRSI